MKIFPKSRVHVTNNLAVWVSNHYQPTLFGIRGKYETSYKSGQYIECGTPGTGFFVRTGSSHSYKNFCKKQRAKLEPKYLDLLLNREFSFDDEIARAEDAMDQTDNAIKKKILNSYANVLRKAKVAEACERQIAGIKELGKRRKKLSSYQTHVMSNLKSTIATYGHEVRNLQLYADQMAGEEKYKEFAKVVLSYSKMASSHRIWHSREAYGDLGNSFSMVFFDLGIFNFIQAPLMTPMMRTSSDAMIWIYPDYIIIARDAVDFDVIDMKDVMMENRMVPYDMISAQVLESYAADDEVSHTHRRNYEDYGDGLLASRDTVSTAEKDEDKRRRERVVGELFIGYSSDPTDHDRFYIHDARACREFAEAFKEYLSYLKSL